MQHISTYIPQRNPGRGGGRASSPVYRESRTKCEDFTGLEADVNRYDLLLLVKRTGKCAGFSPRMIQLLDYYMAYTTELDWEEGSRPVVFQSISRTALDLGVSERQIQKLEKQLFEAGAITYNDSGNHKRYGQRDPATGRILYAFGVELTPLAYLREELEEKLQEKRLYDQAWLETKRQISWHRRQIRSMLIEMREEGACSQFILSLEDAYEGIAMQLRTHIDLSAMRSLLERHKALYARLIEFVAPISPIAINALHVPDSANKTARGSCTSEPEDVHYKYTTPSIKNYCSPQDHGFQKSVAEPSVPDEPATASGAQHVSIKQVLLVASGRYRSCLPIESSSTTWNDVVDAAYLLRTELGISQKSWGEACEVLGRVGASLCVLLTDRAAERPDNPVRQPAAYFRGMVNRARAGELRLHASVFGLTESERNAWAGRVCA